MTNPTEAPMANAIDDVKLLPCPFCGGEGAYQTDTEEEDFSEEWIGCLECGATTALEIWNRRSSPTPSKHTGWSDEAVEAAAKSVYELDPFYEGGEYVDSFMVSPGGNLTWEQACTRDAEFADIPNLGSVTKFAWAAARAALSAASSIAPATGFEVKALEWEPVQDEGVETEQATTPFGYYRIFEDEDSAAGALFVQFAVHPDRFCMVDAISVDRVHSWNGAKAAAQADFDRRIRSSISPSVSKESGEP